MTKFENLLAQRAAQASLSEADFVIWANAPTTVQRSRIITYRDIYAVVGKEKTAAIAAVIKAANPIADGLLYGTGVDIQNPDCQAMLTQISAATGGAVTADDAAALSALGAGSVPAPASNWGYPRGITADDLAAATTAVAVAAQKAQLLALRASVMARLTLANQRQAALGAALAAGTLVTLPTVDELLVGA